MLDRENEYIKMAEVERNHWWYKNLHRLVLDAIKSRFNSRDVGIIDAGCGTGGLLLFLKDKKYSNAMGFDLSHDGVDICRAKGLNVVQHDLSRISELYPRDRTDVIISNDTFYFFDMKMCAQIIKQCYQVLKPNGLLILNFPACDSFRGIHDLSVGIKHRFTKDDIHILFNSCKFDKIKMTYWPFLLSPAIYLERLRQRIKMKVNPSFKISSDIDMPNEFLNSFLTGITYLENTILPVKPIGSSLFIVANKSN